MIEMKDFRINQVYKKFDILEERGEVNGAELSQR